MCIVVHETHCQKSKYGLLINLALYSSAKYILEQYEILLLAGDLLLQTWEIIKSNDDKGVLTSQQLDCLD